MKINYLNPLRLALLCLLFSAFTFNGSLKAQDFAGIAQSHIRANAGAYKLSQADLSDLIVTDQTTSRKSGVVHVYMRQAWQGIGIYGAEMNVNLKPNGEVLSAWNRAIPGIDQMVNATAPGLSAEQAIASAAQHYGWEVPSGLSLIKAPTGADQSARYSAGNISQEEIPVKLMYVRTDASTLRLAWDFNILPHTGSHWWSLKVDAMTGAVIDEFDWTIHCTFNHGNNTHTELCMDPVVEPAPMAPAPPVANSYNVFADPVESPNHGSRTVEIAPWTSASPFGWHDTNGSAGAEYTITRGNNAHAYEDQADANAPGYSPSGGASLDFNFPLNLASNPNTYVDAAITNLFFWNNRMHDVWHAYGFDEANGNFQQNNYGNGGAGNDYVRAEGQDGGGMDNANFSTPTDGTRPRMQMYLWTGQSVVDFVVNSPAGIAGSYYAVPADFGPAPPTTPLTNDLVLVSDGSAAPTEACNPLVNGAQLNGKIALIDRGNCLFVDKVMNAQNAGAIAVVMCNNVPGPPITMGGTTGSITIPSVMISQNDCNTIKAQLGSGVNVSLSGSVVYDRDGDFDNGVIAHEYGHGISTRLTGGPNNSNCLNNSEQMGEGWSDWFGIMLTMKSSDVGTTLRGVGTYATFQPTNGVGIRDAPYTTSMIDNPFTYGDVNTVSVPHGVGFVWCSMLWEMSWALIDEYGFDPDFVNGTGGNNIAMELVIEGLKLQPCSPGFVDGRDAILDADTLLYGGANSCLIWGAFAKRGLGFSASQGSTNNLNDGVEAFDVPPCVAAAFSVSTDTICAGDAVTFTDQTVGSIVSWNWNFGDGNNSTQQNPSHTYSTAGTYTVTLTVSNGSISDTEVKTSYITVNAAPALSTTPTHPACGNPNGAATVAATGNGGFSYNWSNGGNTATISGLAAGTYTVTVTDANGCTSTTSLTLTNQAGPSVGISSTTDAACGASTGEATAAGTGGTGSLSYNWSNGANTATASGLAAGTYTVTVTDQNGCTSTAVANISNLSGPTLNISSTVHTSCGLSNGSATASGNGGTGSLSYIWSTGDTTTSVSNLAPGNYSVTVTDQGGCVAVNNVTIDPSSSPTPGVASSSDATCDVDNGTAMATATGGDGNYSYLWSNGATADSISGLGAGTYTVTVTDGEGCTGTTSVTIAQSGSPSYTADITYVSCIGNTDGSVTLNVTGGTPPYSYNWSTGGTGPIVQNLAVGTYFFTVTDANGCSVSSTALVDQNPFLSGSTSSTDESFPGANDGTASATPTGGTPPYTYSWSNGGSTSTITGLSSGQYIITVTDSLGCTWITPVQVGVGVGIGELPEGVRFELWPNPNTGAFNLDFVLPSPNDLQVSLVNHLGQAVLDRREAQAYQGRLEFNIKDIAGGVYYLRISTNEFTTYKKVVITR